MNDLKNILWFLGLVCAALLRMESHALDGPTVVDLSHPFDAQTPTFPGYPSPKFWKTRDLFDGNPIVEHHTNTGLHNGTHIDGPAHMIPDGRNVNDYSVDKFLGRGVLIDARGLAVAHEDLLDAYDIQAGDMVLVMFDWSKYYKQEHYYTHYPVLSEGFARKLATLGVSMVGMDTPGPDALPFGLPAGSPLFVVHKVLLSHDILIMENLNDLLRLYGRDFDVVALPAAFRADSAIARIVATFKKS